MVTFGTLNDFLPLKKDSLNALIDKRAKLICALARRQPINGVLVLPTDPIVKSVLASIDTAINARGGATNARKKPVANSRQSG